MYSAIVLRTPIDTGRARSCWNVSTGSCDTSVKPEDKFPKGSQHIETIQENDIEKPKNGEDIYISNNLPYIRALEYGHSKQSPTGMVGVVKVNAQQYFVQAIEEVKGKK